MEFRQFDAVGFYELNDIYFKLFEIRMINRAYVVLIIFILAFSISAVSTGHTISLQCNGQMIPVNEQNDVPLSYRLNTYKYARVTYDGKPLDLEISVSGFQFDNADWDISPHSYGIKGIRKGNKLLFTVDRSGYLVVRFNKDQDFTKRLVILVEPPEKPPEGEFVNIVETYKIDITGTKNETKKIQEALDDISSSGKILYFPSGKYKTFGLQIKGNSDIFLSKEARIIADASDLGPYTAKDNTRINRFILIDNAHNIRVNGLGIIDGNGSTILGLNDPTLVKKLDGMRLIFMVNSRNVVFDGILLKDAARWNTHILGCEDVTFRNCKLMNSLINNEHFGSLDGWDPDASKRVMIENCFAWTGDDNVAIKCTGLGNPGIIRDVEDITVRGCVFLTKKTSLKIGTETRCDYYKRIIFEDNDIIEADRVMGINVRDKAIVDGIVFENIRSEYNYPDRKQTGINIYITRRDDDQPWTGKIRNVRIENCSFEQAFPNKIQISRLEQYTEPKDLQVTFKNLTIGNTKVNFLNPDFFNLSKCNGIIKFD